jgi:tRNA uridine 5-carbamoylmethylation protein Kti12
MDTPLDTCLQRDAKRIYALPPFMLQNLYRQYEHPTMDEGWDDIYCITQQYF